jgi:hypothetical protein
MGETPYPRSGLFAQGCSTLARSFAERAPHEPAAVGASKHGIDVAHEHLQRTDLEPRLGGRAGIVGCLGHGEAPACDGERRRQGACCDVGARKIAEHAGRVGAKTGGSLEIFDRIPAAMQSGANPRSSQERLEEAEDVIDAHREGPLRLGRVSSGFVQLTERHVRRPVSRFEPNGIEEALERGVRLTLRRVSSPRSGLLCSLGRRPAHRCRLLRPRCLVLRAGDAGREGGS